jgi:hypothetical protein
VSDNVTVQGTAAHGSPTGNVDFYVCQTGTSQTLTTGPCPVSPGAHLDQVRLTAAASNSSNATSSAFVPGSTGTWCFSAVYGGTAPYTGSQDNTSSSNLDANECVLVTPAGSTTASDVSAATIVQGPGGTVTDTVDVSGDVVGGSPTGSVDFYVCQTGTTQTLTTGPCAATGTPQDSSVALVPGAGATSSATSSAFAPSSPGTWCFSATYGGSSTYAGSSDNTSSSNPDSDECVLVNPPPTPPGDNITSADTATAYDGDMFSFKVTTTGSPTPTIKKKGKLPRGLHLVDNGNGTATISGVPAVKHPPAGYTFKIVAKFGTGKTKKYADQTFTLSVL